MAREANNRAEQDEDDVTSPWASRWWQMSALFLAVLLVLGVLVVIKSGGGSSKGEAGPSAPTSSPSASASTGKGACPELTDTGQEIPRTAPPANWALFRTVAVPSSKASGPAVVNGDVARCYAHTPTGALFAAAQISIRYTVASDWQTVIKKQTYGDGQAGLIKQRAKYEKEHTPVAPVPGELGQFAGFQFVTYSKDIAVLQLVTKFSGSSADSALQVSTVTLHWDSTKGDWLYEIPAVAAPQKSVPDLSGYVTWGGL